MRVLLISVLAVIFFVQNAQSAQMTEQQFQSAVKLLRKVCQPKNKISNDQLDALHNGEFSKDPNLMCYMDCILRTGQIMKDGKINMEALTAQMANLPPTISEPGLKSIDNCKSAPKGTEKCEAAYEFYKCFYDDNPANFFLP